MNDSQAINVAHHGTAHGTVVQIELNRPEALNALNAQLLSELATAFEAVDAEPEARVIVLSGAGRVFAAGGDLKAMAASGALDVRQSDTGQYWRRMQAINKPVIAAVHGLAYGGGCELAMQSDLIIAADDARFAQPEILVGIMPGAGGTQRLARAIGPYRAMEMILTGEPIRAQDALRAGLINRIVPPERLLAEALALATTIAARPPIAVRLARQALREGFETTLRQGLQIERQNFQLLFDTADQAEGMQAFIEKRRPDFHGE